MLTLKNVTLTTEPGTPLQRTIMNNLSLDVARGNSSPSSVAMAPASRHFLTSSAVPFCQQQARYASIKQMLQKSLYQSVQRSLAWSGKIHTRQPLLT